MSQHFGKTDSGREEIKSRSRKLSRPARNLLLVVDATRSSADWLQLVHRASDDDLKQLLSEGLIEAKQAAATAAPRAASIEQAIATLTQVQLYSLLTSQARDRLGLVGGFKFILDVEKCADLDELRKLGLKFLEMVETHQGQAQAQQMRRALGYAT